MTSSRRRLDSWKEISAYLGKNQRTAMRWETERGLPVRRPPGNARAAVFAYSDEIDDWLSKDGLRTLETEAAPASGEENRSARNLLSVRTAVLIAAMASVVAGAAFLLPSPTAFRVTNLRQITHDPFPKVVVRSAHGKVFVSEEAGDLLTIAALSSEDAVPHRVAITGVGSPRLEDVSPDGSNLILRDCRQCDSMRDSPLFVAPASGGEAHPVPQSFARAARWSTDGKDIFYLRGSELWLASLSPFSLRRLLVFRSPASKLAVSPDGSHLAVVTGSPTLLAETLWVSNTDGSGLHEVFSAPDLEAAWTPDGAVVICSFGQPGAARQLTVVDLHGRSGSPFAHLAAAAPLEGFIVKTSDRSRIFLGAVVETSGEMLQFDPVKKSFGSFLPATPLQNVAYHPLQDMMAYTTWPASGLWLARRDGSMPKQLFSSPAEVLLPSFSPDGLHVAVTAHDPKSEWRVQLLDLTSLQLIRATNRPATEPGEGDPTWLPDGRSIVFGDIDCQGRTPCGIHQVDLASRAVRDIPGSAGLRTARVSPDGRSIAALRPEGGKVLLFNFQSAIWTTLSSGITGDDLAWTRDGAYLYAFRRHSENPALVRIRIADHRVETIANLNGIITPSDQYSFWLGLDDRDRPLFFHSFAAEQIFAADLKR